VISSPNNSKLTDNQTLQLRNALEQADQKNALRFIKQKEVKGLLKHLFSSYYLPTRASDMITQPIVEGSFSTYSYNNHSYTYSTPSVIHGYLEFYGTHFTNGNKNFNFVDIHYE